MRECGGVIVIQEFTGGLLKKLVWELRAGGLNSVSGDTPDGLSQQHELDLTISLGKAGLNRRTMVTETRPILREKVPGAAVLCRLL